MKMASPHRQEAQVLCWETVPWVTLRHCYLLATPGAASSASQEQMRPPQSSGRGFLRKRASDPNSQLQKVSPEFSISAISCTKS